MTALDKVKCEAALIAFAGDIDARNREMSTRQARVAETVERRGARGRRREKRRRRSDHRALGEPEAERGGNNHGRLAAGNRQPRYSLPSR